MDTFPQNHAEQRLRLAKLQTRTIGFDCHRRKGVPDPVER